MDARATMATVRPPARFDPVLPPDRAGWTWDPTRRYDYLYWDGSAWTGQKIGGPPDFYWKRPPRRRPTFVLATEPQLPLVRRMVYVRLRSRPAQYLDVGDGFLVLGGRWSINPFAWVFGLVGPKLIAFPDTVVVTTRGSWMTISPGPARRAWEFRIRADVVKLLAERGFEVVGT